MTAATASCGNSFELTTTISCLEEKGRVSMFSRSLHEHQNLPQNKTGKPYLTNVRKVQSLHSFPSVIQAFESIKVTEKCCSEKQLSNGKEKCQSHLVAYYPMNFNQSFEAKNQSKSSNRESGCCENDDNSKLKPICKVRRSQTLTNIKDTKNESQSNRTKKLTLLRQVSLKEKVIIIPGKGASHLCSCHGKVTRPEVEIRSMENGSIQIESELSKTNGKYETTQRSGKTLLNEKFCDTERIDNSSKKKKLVKSHTDRDFSSNLAGVTFQRPNLKAEKKCKSKLIATNNLPGQNILKSSKFHSDNEINFDETSLLIESEAQNRGLSLEVQTRGRSYDATEEILVDQQSNNNYRPTIIIEPSDSNNATTTATEQQQSNVVAPLLRQSLSRTNQEAETNTSRLDDFFSELDIRYVNRYQT